MIKEAWDSLKENVKERVSNPFLGTFIIVWIVHNWPIVYSFFYFDNDWKLDKKIKHFNIYWSNNNFFWNLIGTAFITIGILIITYLFLAISRFLANYFENVIIPRIHKMTKGKIVTAETHQSSLNRILFLETKMEEERKLKNEAISDRDELEKRLYNSQKIDNNTKNEFIDYRNTIDSANSIFGKNNFEKTLLSISKGESFESNNAIIDLLLKHGLIELTRRGGSSFYYYKFTKAGIDFTKQYFKE
jgi:hypothetical protein